MKTENSNQSSVISCQQKTAVKFTDLIAWQEGHKLVIAIYEITKNFPNTETFGLISQICRAVVSITSNIAEGFGRNTISDKTHFYDMARGSLNEVKNQLIIARDIRYIDEDDFAKLFAQTDLCGKVLYGLIRSTRNRTTDYRQQITDNRNEKGENK